MKFFLIFLFTLISSPFSYAHQPYLVKQWVIAGKGSEPVILEKLYGDGIFTADPVAFQIRNQKGAVLATTPVSDHFAFLCPKIQFCFAFAYNSFSLFATAYRLDADSVDWDAEPVHQELDEGVDRDFKNYLKFEDEKRFSGGELSYPEEALKDKQPFNFHESAWAKIFSPFFIIGANIVPLFVITFLSALPLIIISCYRNKRQPIKKTYDVAIKFAGLIVFLLYLGISMIVLFLLAFTFGMPIFYMGGAICLGCIYAVKREKVLRLSLIKKPL